MTVEKGQSERRDRVLREDLETLLLGVAEQVLEPQEGIFGRDSFSWRINREAALFLGAGRAALLQLAHPWVAVALRQHSSLLNDPIARFHNTFRIVFTTIFGTLDQALSAARSLHTLHTQIRGNMPERIGSYQAGSSYEANFVPALVWVFATLVESAVLAYEVAVGPLSQAERDAYYAESKTLAALFGIPRGALPGSWDEFVKYMKAMSDSDELGVDVGARSMAHRLLAGAGSWVRPPHWYRSLTTEWMPARLRDEFGLVYGEAEWRAAESAKRWLPRVYRRMPEAVRFVGPYQEARRRLEGKRAGVSAKTANRFWIGRPLLPFGR